MNGKQLFQEYHRLIEQNAQYQVAAYVWHEGLRWNVSGMNGNGLLVLVAEDRESTQIEAAEMELPVEFYLFPVEEEE